MRKSTIFVLAGALLLAGSSLFGQGKGGDAAKGKGVFEQNCAVCHNSDSAEVKMGPGLKGVTKKPKMTEAAIRAKVDAGGNGMPSYKDILSDAEKNDVIAFLKTL
jgi:cytochrome c